jgi:hypothetical protein
MPRSTQDSSHTRPTTPPRTQILLSSLLSNSNSGSGNERARGPAASSSTATTTTTTTTTTTDGCMEIEVDTAATEGGVEAAVAARFEGYVAMGSYVTIDVVGVPQAAAAAALQRMQGNGGGGVGAVSPLVAFALLRYENRTSVLHFNIQK